MSGPRFSPIAVAEIRAQFAARTLNVRAWAEAYKVSLETIRRIARGDTYRDEPPAGSILLTPKPQGPIIPPQGAEAEAEPDPEEIAASFARLQAATAEVPPRAEALLDEMLQRGRPPAPPVELLD